MTDKQENQSKSDKKLIGMWNIKEMLEKGMTPKEIAEIITPEMNKEIDKIS